MVWWVSYCRSNAERAPELTSPLLLYPLLQFWARMWQWLHCSGTPRIQQAMFPGTAFCPEMWAQMRRPGIFSHGTASRTLCRKAVILGKGSIPSEPGHFPFSASSTGKHLAKWPREEILRAERRGLEPGRHRALPACSRYTKRPPGLGRAHRPVIQKILAAQPLSDHSPPPPPPPPRAGMVFHLPPPAAAVAGVAAGFLATLLGL